MEKVGHQKVNHKYLVKREVICKIILQDQSWWWSPQRFEMQKKHCNEKSTKSINLHTIAILQELLLKPCVKKGF